MVDPITSVATVAGKAIMEDVKDTNNLIENISIEQIKVLRKSDDPAEKQLGDILMERLLKQASSSTMFPNIKYTALSTLRLIPKVSLPIIGEKSAEYMLSEDGLQKDMKKRVEDIPDESKKEAKTKIVHEALDRIAYATEDDEPSLRELYLNLLAKSADKRTDDTHFMAFLNILGQLSPDEARIFNIIAPVKIGSCCNIKLEKKEDGSHKSFKNNIIELYYTDEHGNRVYKFIPSYIDNYSRLGLIDISYISSITNKSAYEFVDEILKTLDMPNEQKKNHSFHIEKGYFSLTDFGKEFAKVVGI